MIVRMRTWFWPNLGVESVWFCIQYCFLLCWREVLDGFMDEEGGGGGAGLEFGGCMSGRKMSFGTSRYI